MRLFSIIVAILAFAQFLVFAQASNTELFLLSIDKNDGKLVFSGAKNISNNPGYDNQPAFSLNGKSILFTSIRGGEDPNIFEYFISDGKTTQITTSTDGEYSPRELDEFTITFIREGSGQEMTVWKINRATKLESPALKIKEPIGYYSFNESGDALVWVRYAFMIHWINTENGVNEFVADYAQPSIPQLIPATDSFSFMQRLPNDEVWIKAFDPKTKSVRPIVQTKDGKKDYCWMPDGSLLIGSGSKLFRFDEKVDKTWQIVADLNNFNIKDITRMSVSADGKNLVFASNQ